jgi:hypothetical protein
LGVRPEVGDIVEHGWPPHGDVDPVLRLLHDVEDRPLLLQDAVVERESHLVPAVIELDEQMTSVIVDVARIHVALRS